MEQVKSYLPVIIRYAIMAVASALATRGWVSSESQSILSQNIDILVGGVVAILTVIYALVKRPSVKAMEVAKEVDKKIPSEDRVFIATPGPQPDIVVEGTSK